jgi:acetoin utilization deacetylase AcuC-like enzyme
MIIVTSNHSDHDPDRFTTPADARPYWEVPARADALLGALRDAGLAARPASDHGLDPLGRVHDRAYLQFLETAFQRWHQLPGGGPIFRPQAYAARYPARLPQAVAGQAGYYLSSSAPIVAGSWAAARGAADAALDAAGAVAGGERFAYALCRPPGHHAHTDMAAGFCYLNNAAIAGQHLLDRGASRVAILDFDVHHGNGTQQIFYDRDDVHYVSVHGDPAFLYPWFAGYADETGQGRGLGCNLNLPLAPGTGNTGFIEAVASGLEAIVARRPAALIVSLGFDAQEGDPAANLAVNAEGFAAVGRLVAQAGVPTVLIQEGGYLVSHLAANLSAFLRGLGVVPG